MNIFEILKNLYTNKKSDWINTVDETQVQPYVIQRWLAMNDRVRVQARWLDKYVFPLTPKMYLSLAWSVLPKTQKTPYIRYIKQVEEEQEFDFLLSKVRKQFELADNDFNSIKGRLIENIKSNMVEWFCFYGVPKKYWKKYYLDFDLIKKYGVCEDKSQRGLEAWGL